MKPPKSRKAELAPNAMGGGKSHAEIAESAELKMTELGLIPVDWEVKKIGDLACVCTGNCNTQDKVDTGKYPFYVRSPIVERINQYGFETEGVITVGDGVGTGKVFHYVNGKFALHQRCYLIYRFCPMLDGKYLYKIFSARFYDRVMQMTAKSSVDSVRREMITDMLIPFPPLAEQRRIAGALSDVDELISALGKLIEKKRNIKTGAMQQLLTGKTRLPGFGAKHAEFKQTELGLIPVDWEVKRLGEIAEICTGKRNGDEQVENGIYPFFVRSSSIYRINTFSYEGEAILIPGEGGIGDIFHYINGRFDFHQRVYKVSDFAADVCAKYIYYCMRMYFSGWAHSQTVKATVDSLRLPTFELFQVRIPPLSEQKAIAAVLSDMDAEIAALEADRAKYERIKSGMMQELLTGKTRLKP